MLVWLHVFLVRLQGKIRDERFLAPLVSMYNPPPWDSNSFCKIRRTGLRRAGRAVAVRASYPWGPGSSPTSRSRIGRFPDGPARLCGISRLHGAPGAVLSSSTEGLEKSMPHNLQAPSIFLRLQRGRNAQAWTHLRRLDESYQSRSPILGATPRCSRCADL